MEMLRLLPEQISRHWELIHEVLENINMSGTPFDQEIVTRIAEKLISGQVQCWVVNEDKKLAAFVFTAIIVDSVLGLKNLLLIGIYSLELAQSLNIWKKGLMTLQKYAQGNSCKNIVFYTNIPELIQIANKFGANTEFVFGVIPT